MSNNPDVIFYDLETYRNFFSATFKRGGIFYQFKIHGEQNDYIPLLQFFANNRSCIFVGYNSFHFDDIILAYLILKEDQLKELNVEHLTYAIKNLADFIITKKDEWNYSKYLAPFKYHKQFKVIDLMEVIREGYTSKSLKLVGVNIKWNKLQDLPIHHDAEVHDPDLIMEYNMNDVDITEAIYNSIVGRMNLRDKLTTTYGVDVTSSADSKIAKDILDTYFKNAGVNVDSLRNKRTKYNTPIKISEVISPKIKFKTEKYQNFLKEVQAIEVSEDTKLKLHFDSDLITHDIAMGGIHGAVKNKVFTTTDEYTIYDLDFGSYYPYLMLTLGVVPEHIKDKQLFLDTLRAIVEDRISAKKIDPIKADGLKIAVNTIYGLLNSETYWLEDRKAQLTVTINGQLYILMVCETLEQHGYQVIYSNTDGYMVLCPKGKEEFMHEINNQFATYTGIGIETEIVEKIVFKDVNNYYCKFRSGKQKFKGCFLPQGGILKGFVNPIVATALQKYYVDGIKPEEYIPTHPDIHDFCTAFKIDDKFTNIHELVQIKTITHSPKTGKAYVKPKQESVILSSTPIQKSCRFYVSIPTIISDDTIEGYRIRKMKVEDGVQKFTDLCAGFTVTLANDITPMPITERQINYQYYIDKANEIINEIN